MELESRRAATQKTLNEWRGRAFDWDSSSNATCVHMLDAHMRNMGHNPPSIPVFKTMLGAVKALNSRGYADLTEMMDALLERRPSVSFMRLGDIALTEGEGPLDAILICAGPLKVFGWDNTRDDVVVMDIDLNKITGAWVT